MEEGHSTPENNINSPIEPPVALLCWVKCTVTSGCQCFTSFAMKFKLSHCDTRGLCNECNDAKPCITSLSVSTNNTYTSIQSWVQGNSSNESGEFLCFFLSSILAMGKEVKQNACQEVVQTQPISQISFHRHQQQRRVRISLELIPLYKRVSTMTQCYDNRAFINVSLQNLVTNVSQGKMQTRITSQFLPKWAAARQSWISAHI